MAQENVIITLPGGASGAYITTFDLIFNPTLNRWELVGTHKDGSTTVIDLTPIIVNLSVQGGQLLGNGDYALEVVDVATGTTTNLIIPLSNFYTISAADVLYDEKVDKIVGFGLSEEDYSTVDMEKLGFYADTLVSDVSYVQTALKEDLEITYTGPGGITTKIISKFFEKVDKRPGWDLSEVNFSPSLNVKLGWLNTDGARSIAYNATTREVSKIDYMGTPVVQFTLPLGDQSDWDATLTTDPAFIKNKDTVTDAIAANTTLITNNAADINTNVLDIADNAAAILLQNTDISAANSTAQSAFAAVTAAHTDIQNNANVASTNEGNITTIFADQATQDNKITALEVLSGNYASSVQDIIDLQTCCTTQTATNNTQASAISNLGIQQGINTSGIATNLANINLNDVDISTLQGQMGPINASITTLGANIATNTGNITTNTNAIANLISNPATITDGAIKVGYENNLDTNAYTDDDEAKVANLPANQMAVDAAQDIIIGTALQPADVVNDLTTGGIAVPLSAEQGVVLDAKIAVADWNIDPSVMPGSANVGRIINKPYTVNDLTTGGTTDLLSAQQGVALNGMISNILDGTTPVPSTTTVVNNLTTGGTTDALSAQQGVVLQGEIDGIFAGPSTLAGVTLTGDPQAPTPNAGDSDTSIATTAFVTTTVNAAITAAGGVAVDNVLTSTSTVNALSANMGNTLQIAKAPLASPVFTGDPQAPTPAVGDNDTSIATTAFIQTTLGDYVATVEKAAVNGVATLDANQKIPLAQLPSMTISHVYAVVDIAEMLTLDAGAAAANGGVQVGDFVTLASGDNYIVETVPGTNIGDWIQITAPGAVPVKSDWAVTDATSLSYIDNKPLVINDLTTGGSTDLLSAQQGLVLETAKADLASPAFTGNPIAPTPAANDNDTSIATTAFVQTELVDVVKSTTVSTIVSLSQAAYDGIGTPNAQTLYIIV